MVTKKRCISLFLVCVMLVSLFAGCGSSGKNNTGSSSGNKDTASATDSSSTNSNSSSSSGSDAVSAYPSTADAPTAIVQKSEPPKGFAETAVPNTLTAAMSGEPTTLFPLEGNEIPVNICVRPLYETLVVYNEFTGEYEPGLAESWEFIDDLTLRIHLRKGVKCHAGYEMTVQDIIWTATYGQASAKANTVWRIFDIENFEVIDDYTLDMKTYDIFGPILAFLSSVNVAFIVNQQAYEEQSPAEYARNPTGGSGPYKFVEWIAGDRVVYVRNEEYWGLKPYYENLVIRNIADSVTRALSLEAGEVDIIYDVDASNYQTLVDSPTCNVVETPSTGLIHIGLNNAKPPFDDVRVRQAIRYALDLENMVNLAFSGLADVADGCWPSCMPYYKPAEGDLAYEYNPEKAKELLKEAGYDEGELSFELWVCDVTAWIQMAEMIHNALASIGVNANVTTMDMSTLMEKRAKGEHEAAIARISCSTKENNWWYIRLHPDLGYSQNICLYKNERVGELLDSAQASLDEAFREECYLEILDLWRADLPWISLANPRQLVGIRSTLDGIEPHAYGCADLRYVHPINPQ